MKTNTDVGVMEEEEEQEEEKGKIRVINYIIINRM